MRISDWSSDVCSSDLPAALQVLIKAVDGVDLVTALCAAYAEVGADEILVTLTMLAQVVVAQARNDRPRPLGIAATVAPACFAAAVVGAEIDDAARVRRIALWSGRTRKVLPEAARAVIGAPPGPSTFRIFLAPR